MGRKNKTGVDWSDKEQVRAYHNSRNKELRELQPKEPKEVNKGGRPKLNLTDEEKEERLVKIKESQKNYRLKNIEKIKEQKAKRVFCELCCSSFRLDNRHNHLKSLTHQMNLEMKELI